MDNQQEQEISRNRLLQTQHNLGLNQQLFEAKFVYQQQQVLSNSAHKYLLSQHEPLPSQLSGFSISQIRTIQAYASHLIFQAGKSLRVPVTTTALAQTITHFFYCRNSYLNYDIRDVLIGAMFLACKSEETLRKSYQIATVFDYIFKITEQQKKMFKVFQMSSVQYKYIKNCVTKAQLDILFDLGFQVYKLSDLPHRYLGGILNLFDGHPKKQLIAMHSWNILNDIFRTISCLYYPSQILAAVSVYIAMKKVQASFPEIPWWCLMDASLLFIQRIQVQLQFLYNLQPKDTSVQNIARIINTVGQEKQNIINAFPIPYYRKIMLENRNKLRKKKCEIQKIEKEENIQQLNMINMMQAQLDNEQKLQIKNEKDIDQSSHKKKKKIKKEKKKKNKKHKKHKKDKKKKKQKYSSSQQESSHSQLNNMEQQIEKKYKQPVVNKILGEEQKAQILQIKQEGDSQQKKFKGLNLKGLSSFAQQLKKRGQIKKQKQQKQRQKQKRIQQQRQKNIQMKQNKIQSEENDDEQGQLAILAELRRKVLKNKLANKQNK